jgi:hypothetical protein
MDTADTRSEDRERLLREAAALITRLRIELRELRDRQSR